MVVNMTDSQPGMCFAQVFWSQLTLHVNLEAVLGIGPISYKALHKKKHEQIALHAQLQAENVSGPAPSVSDALNQAAHVNAHGKLISLFLQPCKHIFPSFLAIQPQKRKLSKLADKDNTVLVTSNKTPLALGTIHVAKKTRTTATPGPQPVVPPPSKSTAAAVVTETPTPTAVVLPAVQAESDGFVRFTGQERCLYCINHSLTTCVVNGKGYDALSTYIAKVKQRNAKHEPAPKRPANSACTICQQKKATFCHFPITVTALGKGYVSGMCGTGTITTWPNDNINNNIVNASPNPPPIIQASAKPKAGKKNLLGVLAPRTQPHQPVASSSRMIHPPPQITAPTTAMTLPLATAGEQKLISAIEAMTASNMAIVNSNQAIAQQLNTMHVDLMRGQVHANSLMQSLINHIVATAEAQAGNEDAEDVV